MCTVPARWHSPLHRHLGPQQQQLPLITPVFLRESSSMEAVFRVVTTQRCEKIWTLAVLYAFMRTFHFYLQCQTVLECTAPRRSSLSRHSYQTPEGDRLRGVRGEEGEAAQRKVKIGSKHMKQNTWSQTLMKTNQEVSFFSLWSLWASNKRDIPNFNSATKHPWEEVRSRQWRGFTSSQPLYIITGSCFLSVFLRPQRVNWSETSIEKLFYDKYF